MTARTSWSSIRKNAFTAPCVNRNAPPKQFLPKTTFPKTRCTSLSSMPSYRKCGLYSLNDKSPCRMLRNGTVNQTSCNIWKSSGPSHGLQLVASLGYSINQQADEQPKRDV